MKKTFRKYPSNYIRANKKVSNKYFADMCNCDSNCDIESCGDVDASTKVTASISDCFIDNGAGFGKVGEKFTLDEIKTEYYRLCAEDDPICADYGSFDEWLNDTLDSGLLVRCDDYDVDDYDIIDACGPVESCGDIEACGVEASDDIDDSTLWLGDSDPWGDLE